MSHEGHGVRGSTATDAVFALLGLGAFVTATALSPSRVSHGPVLCPFRLITGVPCPTCGMTRSWVELAHGHLEGSLNQHLLGPASMAFALFATVTLAVHLLTRRWVVSPDVLVKILIGLSVAIGVFGVGRWAVIAAGA